MGHLKQKLPAPGRGDDLDPDGKAGGGVVVDGEGDRRLARDVEQRHEHPHGVAVPHGRRRILPVDEGRTPGRGRPPRARIVTHEHVEGGRGVRHPVGEHTTGGETLHLDGRMGDQAAGRFQTDQTIARGGDPYRPAAVLGVREGRHPGCDGHTRATGGTARRAPRVPRVARNTQRLALGEGQRAGDAASARPCRAGRRIEPGCASGGTESPRPGGCPSGRARAASGRTVPRKTPKARREISLPLPRYSAPGGLRQGPGQGAESSAEATTCEDGDMKCVCCREEPARPAVRRRWRRC